MSYVIFLFLFFVFQCRMLSGWRMVFESGKRVLTCKNYILGCNCPNVGKYNTLEQWFWMRNMTMMTLSWVRRGFSLSEWQERSTPVFTDSVNTPTGYGKDKDKDREQEGEIICYKTLQSNVSAHWNLCMTRKVPEPTFSFDWATFARQGTSYMSSEYLILFWRNSGSNTIIMEIIISNHAEPNL